MPELFHLPAKQQQKLDRPESKYGKLSKQLCPPGFLLHQCRCRVFTEQRFYCPTTFSVLLMLFFSVFVIHRLACVLASSCFSFSPLLIVTRKLSRVLLKHLLCGAFSVYSFLSSVEHHPIKIAKNLRYSSRRQQK